MTHEWLVYEHLPVDLIIASHNFVHSVRSNRCSGNKTLLSVRMHCEESKNISRPPKNESSDFKKRKLHFCRLCRRNVRLLVGAPIAATGVAPVIPCRGASFFYFPSQPLGVPESHEESNKQKKNCRSKREASLLGVRKCSKRTETASLHPDLTSVSD